MSWRNQGITGSNNIPLGARRRFGDGNGDSQNGSSVDSPSYGDSGKRGRSPTRGTCHYSAKEIYSNTFFIAEPAVDGVKRRKKRNRWGEADENKAAGLMGLPTMIQANMTAEQLEAYTLHLRIEEISQKLRINDVVPAEGDRSVLSPSSIRHPKILTLVQITISSSSVRQLWSSCEHSRVPIPKATGR